MNKHKTRQIDNRKYRQTGNVKDRLTIRKQKDNKKDRQTIRQMDYNTNRWTIRKIDQYLQEISSKHDVQ